MTNEKNTALTFSCPICKKKVKRTNDDFPFCSARCRTNDLGQWASDEYRIAGEPVTIADDSEGY